MIKKLSLKFLLVFLVLVVSVFITSSCYAVLSDISGIRETPFTSDDVYNEVASYGFTKDNSVLLVLSSSNSYTIWVISPSSELSYVAEVSSGHTSGRAFNSSGSSVTCAYYKFYYSVSTSSFSHDGSVFPSNTTFVGMFGPFGYSKVGDISTITIKDYSGNIVYEPLPPQHVDVTHEFQSDTSAKVNFTVSNAPDGSILKYSLTGVELNTDLTAPLQLRNPVTYTPRSNKFGC